MDGDDTPSAAALLHQSRAANAAQPMVARAIRNMCVDTVTERARMGYTRCTYAVPAFLVGYPVFDVSDCCEGLRASLLAKGFTVDTVSDSTLRISWDQPRQPPPAVRGPRARDRR